jgi:hypothetical protein
MATPAETMKGEIGSGDSAGQPSSGLLANVESLGGSLKIAFEELIKLVVLETRLTARRVSAILFNCLLVTLVLTTMWFGIAVVLALLLMSMEIPPAAAVSGVVLLNLLALPCLLFRIRNLSRNLGFPETRETVTKALDQLLERAAP